MGLSSADQKKLEHFFAQYIGQQKIVIADTSASSRTLLANALVSMGAKANHIILASKYEIAEAEIKKNKPRVVVCDYNLERKYGLDLLQKQRALVPETKESLFLLVTGNTSQSAVAKAAEEDVDAFIIKPFTLEVLKNTILKAAISKLKPSAYVQKIEAGKKELADGKIEGSKTLFEEAKQLDTAPALAFYYEGLAETKDKKIEEAEKEFAEGLTHNKIHYKCMVGLFDILMEKKSYESAYDIVKRISQYFPANPQRLTQVLRLAIMTKNVDDVERYYQLFTNIDERNEELVRYVCAALVTCGKYYLTKNLPGRAFELFDKAAISSGSQVKILKEIVNSLLENGRTDKVEVYMKRYPAELHKTPEYQVLEFNIASHTLSPTLLIEKGQRLIQANVHDYGVYVKMIQIAQVSKMDRILESLMSQAQTRFPEKREDLAKLQA